MFAIVVPTRNTHSPTHIRVNYSDRYIAPTGRKGAREDRREVTSSRVAPGGWRREKLRQGLLTDSDGYHFIRDTILRLPQPTSLPSPPSMPFARPIWSDLILAALWSTIYFLRSPPAFAFTILLDLALYISHARGFSLRPLLLLFSSEIPHNAIHNLGVLKTFFPPYEG